VGRLEGKRAVITGAASGIGEETTRLFIREGASVVLADVDDERGKRIAGECGDRARFVHADVAEEGAVDAAVAVSVDEFGGLDVLFNNAGNPGSVGGILEIDMAMFDRTVAIHLRGVFLGIRAAGRVMRPQGHGSIINTSSVAGLQANYAGHDYSAATDPTVGPATRYRRGRLVAGQRRLDLRQRAGHCRRRGHDDRSSLPAGPRRHGGSPPDTPGTRYLRGHHRRPGRRKILLSINLTIG